MNLTDLSKFLSEIGDNINKGGFMFLKKVISDDKKIA